MPVITALRRRGHDRVQVVLDGAPWRTVPLGAAVDARLDIDVELDRVRARDLNRALRRHAAIGAGLRALSGGAVSTTGVDRRLAQHGVRHEPRAEAIERLRSAGLLDDRRAAASRARALAERGASDAMVLADLEARQFPPETTHDAVAELDPERERATALFARRGADERAARYLAARGYPADLIEELVAGWGDDA